MGAAYSPPNVLLCDALYSILAYTSGNMYDVGYANLFLAAEGVNESLIG